MSKTRIPGFSAEVSIYKSTKSYLMQPAGSFGTLVPQQLPPFGRISRRVPSWIAFCLKGCTQNHTACTNAIETCARARGPDCIAGCQIRCLKLPLGPRQDDCYAGCQGECDFSTRSGCLIDCDVAYGDCQNFCYHPTAQWHPTAPLAWF
jgi:hypothetical protein